MSSPFLKHKLWMAGIALYIAFTLACMPKFFREMDSTRWASAPGEIARSYMQTGYWKSIEGFIPTVQYKYRVGQRDYWGDRIDFHMSDSMYARNYALSWLARYPTGKVVSVYYDPKEPASSVLVPGLQSEQRGLVWLGVAMMAVGVMLFGCVYYDYRSQGKVVRYLERIGYLRVNKKKDDI